MDNYKRQTREMKPETKAKISQSMKNRSKSLTHRQNISKGLTNYWRTVPSSNEDSGENNLTMSDETL